MRTTSTSLALLDIIHVYRFNTFEVCTHPSFTTVDNCAVGCCIPNFALDVEGSIVFSGKERGKFPAVVHLHLHMLFDLARDGSIHYWRSEAYMSQFFQYSGLRYETVGHHLH